MRVQRLEAEGIFSFGAEDDRFALDLDDHLTAIVGPNASGKSNVGRLLKLVQAVASFEAALYQEDRSALFPVLEDHAQGARHEGMPSSARSIVRLGIRLTGATEIGLLTAFVRTLALSAVFANQVVDQQSLPAVEAWAAEHITPEALKDLLEGTIVASHSGVPGALWDLGYEFAHDGVPLTWHISTAMPNMKNVIAPRGRTPDVGLPDIVTLTQRLIGPNRPLPGPVVPPEKPFTIRALLPEGNELVGLEMPSLSSSVAPAAHRAFVALIGLPVPAGDPLGPYRRSYSLAAPLSAVLDRGLRYLGPPDEPLGMVATTARQPARADDGPSGDLVGRLHALKNGDQLAQIRYRQVQSIFEALAPGRRFELRTGRRSSDAETSEPVTEIEVFPVSGDPLTVQPRPLRFAGTGVSQALVIAEAVVGEPDQVLVLDEPATNLHPPWQRLVQSQLGSSGGQCILVTHSPYLMPAETRDQLASVARFGVQGGATRVHRLSEDDLADEWWTSVMIKELAWSADARALLFAAGVVLLEGPTEQAALPIWFAKSTTAGRHRAPGDLHLAFYSVGGDQDFRPFIGYLHRFGVPWAVVCDGAAFRFDVRGHIFEQVLGAGVDDPELDNFVQQSGISSKPSRELSAAVFAAMVEVGRTHGVFTLAGGWHRKKDPEGDYESFEAFVASQPQLDQAASAATERSSKSKPRAGRLLAESTDCPPAVDELYGRILERLWKQGMTKFPPQP